MIGYYDKFRLKQDSLLVGLAIFFAHFGKYSFADQYFPPMNSLFELFFIYGRDLSLFFFLAFLVIYFGRGGKDIFVNQIPVSGMLKFYWALHLFFLLKMLVFGNVNVFIIGLVVLALQFLVLHLYMCSSEHMFLNSDIPIQSRVETSIAVFAVLFALVNIIAFSLYPSSSITHGRFFGTMVNPQHFMMSAVLTLPALLLLIRRVVFFSFNYILLILTIGTLVFLIYQTGSRTGVAVSVFVIGIMSRDLFVDSKIIPTLFLASLLAFLVGAEAYESIENNISENFIEGRENTRSETWALEIEKFIANPLFGIDPSEDGRLYYNESLWLAIASNGGLIGIIISLFLLFYFVESIAIMTFYKGWRGGEEYMRNNMYLAALVAIFGFSIFEAILLGLYTSMAMLCIIYFAGAYVFTSPRLIGQHEVTS